MNDAIEQIHALVDGELSPDQREAVLSSVNHDPSLNREFAWAQALKDLVQSKCHNEFEVAEWQAARNRIRELDRVKTTNHLVSKYAWAICGVLLAGILAAGRLNSVHSTNAAATAGVIPAFESPLQFNDSNRAQTLPNTPDYRFSPFQKGPVLNAQHGEKFYDVHYGGLDGHDMACVRMADNFGPIWVYTIQGTDKVEGVDEPYGDMRLGFVRAHPCVSYSQSGYLVVVMADRNIDQLVDIARRVRTPQ